MLPKVFQPSRVGSVPPSPGCAALGNDGRVELYAVIGSLVGSVIAFLVLLGGNPLGDHLVSRMSFHLAYANRCCGFGFDMLMEDGPKIAIGMKCPWSLGMLVSNNKGHDLEGLGEETLAVCGHMDWSILGQSENVGMSHVK